MRSSRESPPDCIGAASRGAGSALGGATQRARRKPRAARRQGGGTRPCRRNAAPLLSHRRRRRRRRGAVRLAPADRDGLAAAEDLPARAAALIFVGVLVEDFIGTRHAELVARALLDRLGAGLEVAHFRGQRRIAALELRVLAGGGAHLAIEL